MAVLQREERNETMRMNALRRPEKSKRRPAYRAAPPQRCFLILSTVADESARLPSGPRDTKSNTLRQGRSFGQASHCVAPQGRAAAMGARALPPRKGQPQCSPIARRKSSIYADLGPGPAPPRMREREAGREIQSDEGMAGSLNRSSHLASKSAPIRAWPRGVSEASRSSAPK